MMSIADLRRDYRARALSEAERRRRSARHFRQWLDDAVRAELLDATAMTLATASPAGEPAARIVLLKDVSADGFVFFTNYESAKAAQLDANPRACLVFFWADAGAPGARHGAVSRDGRGRERRLFPVAAARQPARRVGVAAEPA